MTIAQWVYLGHFSKAVLRIEVLIRLEVSLRRSLKLRLNAMEAAVRPEPVQQVTLGSNGKL